MHDSTSDYSAIAERIKAWGRELGFQQVGIGGLDLASHGEHLQRWLAAGYTVHGLLDEVLQRIAQHHSVGGLRSGQFLVKIEQVTGGSRRIRHGLAARRVCGPQRPGDGGALSGRVVCPSNNDGSAPT